MINSIAKPRFGLEEDGKSFFDYITSRQIRVGGIYHAPDGAWDTEKLAELIRGGLDIAPAYAGPSDEVEQANADFINEPTQEEIDAKAAADKAEAERLAAEEAERQRLANEQAEAAVEEPKGE